MTTGNPWGTDEPGTLFGVLYGEVVGRALETYASHVDLLVAAADGLVTWAGTVSRVDAAQAASFEALAAATADG